MKYNKIPYTDLNISAVGFGTWALGDAFFGKVDDQQSVEAIQSGIDHGINFIDTAPAYGAGHAEKVVGQAIKGRRDKVIIATKLGIERTKDDFLNNLKPERIYQEIDESLERLGVNQIDLYQIHWPDPDTPLEESVEALMKIKEQGKFRYLGVSNFTPELLDEIRSMTEIVSLQPQYSLLRRQAEETVIPYCQENDLGIISYGTLAGGILTGKFKNIPDFDEKDNRFMFYNFFKEPEWSKIQNFLDVLREIAKERNVPVVQVTINWTIQQIGITSALVGAKNPEQIKINAQAADFELDGEELERIEQAWEKYLIDIGK